MGDIDFLGKIRYNDLLWIFSSWPKLYFPVELSLRSELPATEAPHLLGSSNNTGGGNMQVKCMLVLFGNVHLLPSDQLLKNSQPPPN